MIANMALPKVFRSASGNTHRHKIPQLRTGFQGNCRLLHSTFEHLMVRFFHLRMRMHDASFLCVTNRDLKYQLGSRVTWDRYNFALTRPFFVRYRIFQSHTGEDADLSNRTAEMVLSRRGRP
ncbi:hypothetical protein PMIN06_009568 [Paraphaeosphaeria minitans]